VPQAAPNDAFAGLEPGDALRPFTITISRAANDRYWAGAGVEHPLRAQGALYPLIAANVTILAFQQHCRAAMIQTRQQLVCHRRADAPETLLAHTRVDELWERRGLPYIAVTAEIAAGETPLWTSTVHFTPAAIATARHGGG
jgi:hypothetical protein